MYVVEKKITGWIVLQYKIIISKYSYKCSIILLLYLKKKKNHQEHR
jgi:hypothetical protein